MYPRRYASTAPRRICGRSKRRACALNHRRFHRNTGLKGGCVSAKIAIAGGSRDRPAGRDKDQIKRGQPLSLAPVRLPIATLRRIRLLSYACVRVSRVSSRLTLFDSPYGAQEYRHLYLISLSGTNSLWSLTFARLR